VESLGARRKLASGGDGIKSSNCLSGVVGVDTSRIVESITEEEDEACVGTLDDWWDRDTGFSEREIAGNSASKGDSLS